MFLESIDIRIILQIYQHEKSEHEHNLFAYDTFSVNTVIVTV